MLLKRLMTNHQINTFLIIGLGNPGREYEYTRHNIGYMVIDQLARKWGIEIKKQKFKSMVGEHRENGSNIKLIKPMTYMNNSGDAVRLFFNFYKPMISQMLVVFDDLDLSFGSLRFRQSGGSSGQKGMESIISKLGRDDFPRLRVGIGRPPGRMDVTDFILKPFKPSERELLEMILIASSEAIESFIKDGIEKSMTAYNHSL